MKTLGKRYLAYRGQNMTFGEPNVTTGYYSYYGDLLAFASKSERDEYVKDFYDIL